MTGLPLDTASGVRLDLDDPRPDDITLSDVAAALSKTCRFGAQARSFYSVAQHAVLVADLVEDAGHPELALAALHHDSHEAYACDLPTPLKRRIDAASGGYCSRLCDALDAAIHEAFGISGFRDDPLAAEVIKAADEQALLIESQDLLHDGGRGLRADRDIPESLVDSLPAMRGLLDPSQAEQQFVSAHERLVGLHAAAD